jgi:hypothetical protein
MTPTFFANHSSSTPAISSQTKSYLILRLLIDLLGFVMDEKLLIDNSWSYQRWGFLRMSFEVIGGNTPAIYPHPLKGTMPKQLLLASFSVGTDGSF